MYIMAMFMLLQIIRAHQSCFFFFFSYLLTTFPSRCRSESCASGGHTAGYGYAIKELGNANLFLKRSKNQQLNTLTMNSTPITDMPDFEVFKLQNDHSLRY